MCAMEFPEFGGRLGPDPERASRAYHFAFSQPNWAVRMAAFILSVLLLLVLVVVLLPLILLALVIVGVMMLVARARAGLAGTRSPSTVGTGLRGGRKNVRVRRPE